MKDSESDDNLNIHTILEVPSGETRWETLNSDVLEMT